MYWHWTHGWKVSYKDTKMERLSEWWQSIMWGKFEVIHIDIIIENFFLLLMQEKWKQVVCIAHKAGSAIW